MSDGTIAILAPTVRVSITIESGADGDDIHVHAGGQGIWVARMLRQLDHRPRVCAPVGGESGRTLMGLVGAWGVSLVPVETISDTPSDIHDRRDGERVQLARSPAPELRRHEVDEFYNRFLELALAAGRCVVTGPDGVGSVPGDLFRRLGSDLAASGVEVVADLHGPPLTSFLEGGPIAILKVSAGDLVEDGVLDGDPDRGPPDEGPLDQVAADLRERGVGSLVVSRGDAATLAWFQDDRYRVSGPDLEVVDPRGSGDSMTAALVASSADGLGSQETLARAWAAGAANVTRRGLGSGIPGLVAELAGRVQVERRSPS